MRIMRITRAIARLASGAALLLAASTARADDTKIVTSVDGITALGGHVVDMSSDGRFVLFTSTNSNYVAGDTNGLPDLFVIDRTTGGIERVNVASDGSEETGYEDEGFLRFSSISDDGNLVAFTTAAVFDPDDNPGWDVYLRDRAAGTTTLVSKGSSKGTIFESALLGQVTRDGSHVVFMSTLTTLVSGDTNSAADVFEWEVATGAMVRVSVDSSGKQLFLPNTYPHPSADGSVVAFTQVQLHGDVIRGFYTYVKDLNTGILDRADLDSTGTFTSSYSTLDAISRDGRYVLFHCAESLVPEDTNGKSDGFVRDRTLATTERVTFAPGFAEIPDTSFARALSDDGRRVEFVTSAGLTPDDDDSSQDVFVANRDTGAVLRVSLGPNGEESVVATDGVALSGDGSIALFTAAVDDLWPGDADATEDGFVRELSTVAAAWTNYGSGFPGRNGEPTLVLGDVPRRTLDVTLSIGNSSGTYTVAVLLFGAASQSLPTGLGGTLLVSPLEWIAVPLSPYANDLPFTVPADGNLPGVHVYLQALELDPWAARGVSFTPGLDATIGD
jgi:Tol biopolymer transport system component